jgi:hypothetical protein
LEAEVSWQDDLGELNENAILWTGFEAAYIGWVENRWAKDGEGPVACYSYERCIEILMRRDGMSREDAVEFFEFNTEGGYLGPSTPLVLVEREREEGKMKYKVAFKSHDSVRARTQTIEASSVNRDASPDWVDFFDEDGVLVGSVVKSEILSIAVVHPIEVLDPESGEMHAVP